MDWKRIHQINRKRSARKAARERSAAEAAAKVEKAGGPFKIAELRAAQVRVVELHREYVRITDPHVVWRVRGGEWIVWFWDDEPVGMALLSERFSQRANVVPFGSKSAERYASERANSAHGGT